jgi:putative peptidoglycan binding protein
MRIKASIFAAALALSIAATQALPAAAITTSSTDYGSYSIEQLESLIAKLQQLEELKKGSKCFVSDSDLSLGDGEGGELSADVRRLQDFLREKGLFTYKSTGYFGKITRNAVIAFQKREGIAQTGEFNAATRAKAHAMACKSVIKPKAEVKKDPAYEKKETEKKPELQTSVKSIWLAVGEGGRVHWKVDGHSSMGFKVVWSKTAGPAYPNRDVDRYQYFESSAANQAQLEAFDGAGTYYVRVCQYLGGSCGTYSNEVKVQL